MIRNRIVAIILILFVPAILIAMYLLTPHEQQEIFPGTGNTFLVPWVDSSTSDSAMILSCNQNSDGLNCSYVLGSAEAKAGVTLKVNKELVLSYASASYLSIDIQGKTCNPFQVTLQYQNRKTGTEVQTKPFQVYSLIDGRLDIPLSELLETGNVARDELLLTKISFASSDGVPLHFKQHIAIKGVVLFQKALLGLSPALIFSVFSMVAGVLFLRRNTLRKLFSRKRIDVINRSEKEFKRIDTYLTEHYMESDISVGYVAEMTGVSREKISPLLQRYLKDSFVHYINSLRLEEAKRLLLESDRSVSEISSLVGYSYVNSFNRVFKKEVGNSPTEFRDSFTEKEVVSL